MKFNELSDKDKIRHVKDKYAEIIGEIVYDKSNLNKLIPDMPEPIFTKPEVNEILGKEINDSLLKTAQDAFNLKHKEYLDATATKAKILETISKIKEKDECICDPKCIDIDINYIVPEFEIFIDFARQRAEAQTY